MFTIKAYRGDVVHNYTAECFGENNSENKNIVLDAPALPGGKAKRYILPLTGEKAYNKIEIRNFMGNLIETIVPNVEVPPKKRKTRKKATNGRK